MAKKENSNRLAARQKANELRREQERADRRRRVLIQLGVIVGAILVIAAIVAVVVFTSRDASTVNVPKASATITVEGTPAPFVVGDHRVRIGAEDAAVVLSIYEDYSCPHCKDYAEEVDSTLTELIASGDVAVEFHPIRFVTDYGSRAGSAATCVAVGAPEQWLDVHTALYANYDATTNIWKNNQFRDFLAAQGVTDETVLECAAEGRYVNWIGQSTTAATDAGVTASPTLLINGEASELLSADALRTAVEEILGATE